MLRTGRAADFIVPSEIRIMSVECERVRGVNLAQGICDTPTPDVVREAAIEAIRGGMNQYVRLDGIPPLRHAIARKFADFNRVAFDPEREIVVTSGSTGGFYATCAALLDPGDEVIVFEPFYSYHLNTISAVGAKPVLVRLAAPHWTLDREDLRRAITPRTRMLVLNSPSNPSGKVFSAQEMQWVAELATAHDLFIVTDEIYEYFLYDGRKHVSFATLPGMRERTVTISGFSKTFSVTGWRLGYLACDAKWKPSIAYFHDLNYICAPSPLQAGVTAGLELLGPEFYQELAADYDRKRTALCDALRGAGLEPSVPEGAYYVLADATALPGDDSKQKAMYLLEHAGVAAVPGSAFFEAERGENFLRFCFAKTDADLEDACGPLHRFAGAGARA